MVKDVAVLGVKDDVYGQRISALVVTRDSSHTMELQDLRQFLGSRLAHYKIPTQLLQLQEMPRNAMGKVNKKDLEKLFT
jgi:malonyl-CoA/methylmalonyl-CoA synthetase